MYSLRIFSSRGAISKIVSDSIPTAILVQRQSHNAIKKLGLQFPCGFYDYLLIVMNLMQFSIVRTVDSATIDKKSQ